MKTPRFLLVALVLCAFQAFLEATCPDPISCYLQTLEFNVPPVQEKVGLIEFKIKNMVCKGIDLAGIPSTYDQASATKLHASAQGATGTCSGHYQYGLMDGTVTAKVSKTTVTTDAELGKTGELPTSLKIENCKVSEFHSDISFSGSFGSDILNVIDPIIELVIKNEINKLACTMGAEAAAKNATYALQTVVDPMLKKILSSQPSKIPTFSSEMFNWRQLWDKVQNSAWYKRGKECIEASGVIPQSATRPYLDYAIDMLTGGTGKIKVPLWLNLPIREGQFTIEYVTLDGLNNFTDFEVFGPSPANNQTMQTKITLPQLDLIGNIVTYAAHPQGYSDDLDITIRLYDVDFVMETTLAVNATAVTHLFVDQLTSPGCILKAVEYLNVTSLRLNMNLNKMHLVQTGGAAAELELDVITLSDNVFDLLIHGFGDLMTDTLNGVFQGPVRKYMNEFITDLFKKSKSTDSCYPHNKNIGNQVDNIVWADNMLVGVVSGLLNSAEGTKTLNKVLHCFLNETGSVSFGNSSQVIAGMPFPWHVKISNIDSLYNMSLLESSAKAYKNTYKPYNILNGIGFGYCSNDAKDCKPLVIEASFKPPKLPFLQEQIYGLAAMAGSPVMSDTMLRGLNPQDLMLASGGFPEAQAALEELQGILPWLSNETTVAVSLKNFSLYADMLAVVNMDTILALAEQQVGTRGCMASAATSMQSDVLDMYIGNATCDVDKGKMEFDFTKAMNKIIPFASKVVKSVVDAKLKEVIEWAAPTCANGGVMPMGNTTGPSTNPPQEFPSGVIITFSVGAVILIGIYFVCFRRWRHKENEPERCEAEDVYYNDMSLSCCQRVNRYFEDTLIRNSTVPWVWRYGLFLSILLNIGLFIWSNSSVAVQVQAVVHIFSQEFPTQKIEPPSLFDFSLRSSVDDMWQAGVYPLAILIAFFSGAWPYLKLLSMGACLCLPVRRLSLRRREQILQIMDVLGKWSLIDFIVLSLFMCAFYFDMVLINPEPVQPQYIEKIVINSYVVPQIGIYTFIAATVASLINGHFTLALHRRTELKYEIPAIPAEFDKEEAMCNHLFSVSEDIVQDVSGTVDKSESNDVKGSAFASDKHKLRATKPGIIVAFLTLLASCVITYAGVMIYTFQFEMKGATGWLLGNEAVTQYNILKVGERLPMGSGTPDAVGVRIIQIFFFAFGISMPVLLHIMLFILWFVPMKTKRQNFVFVITEVVNAWTALDVFCISIVACLLEIRQLSAFIIGDKCDVINEYLKEYMDDVLGGDDKCFDVEASLLPMCWALFLAALSCSVVAIPSLAVAYRNVDDRRMIAQELHELQDGGVYEPLMGDDDRDEEGAKRLPTGEEAVEDIMRKKMREKSKSAAEEVKESLLTPLAEKDFQTYRPEDLSSGESFLPTRGRKQRKARTPLRRFVSFCKVYFVKCAISLKLAEVVTHAELVAEGKVALVPGDENVSDSIVSESHFG